MKISEYLLQTLEQNGVSHIFGNPGTTELPLVKACEPRKKLKYVVALSEVSAVPMADGYARATRSLGVVNLHAVIRSPKDQSVRVVGFKGRLLARFSRTSHPVLIASVGAAFALSFDTVSQAALFSLAASKMSGWLFAVTLGLVFMAGMMIADGVNGWCVGRAMQRADAQAIAISRTMSFVIGALSIAIAALGIVKFFSPTAAAVLDGNGLFIGIGLAVCIPVFFVIVSRSSNRVVPGQSR